MNDKNWHIMNSSDWYEITKAKKMAKANDASSCGNAITEYRDNIVILEHGTNFRKYVIPKSKGYLSEYTSQHALKV
jgi:hypothetical protein